MTATNTSKPAKDGTGTAFTLEMASESVSQNIAQKTYIGSPSTEALVEPPTQADVMAIKTALGTPAQDGADATGVTPPTGAVGIRGWLSSIYNKLTGSLAVTGTFWQTTQPISAASLPLPAGAATAANQPTAAAQGSTTSGQTGRLMQGAVTIAAPAYATAQTSPLSLDTAGNLRVNVVAGSASGNVAQGSTTSGETGVMIQGAVTTAAPSYTTAQTSPVSLTTAGAVRTDASATTQPVSGSVTANAGTNLNTASLALESGGNLASIKTNTAITAAGTTATSGAPVQGMTGGVALPVSIASLPALATGSNAIGSIIGRTTMATVTPTVTSNGAYLAGNEIGGLMTFPVGGAGSGTLMSLRVTSKSILTTALKAYIFTANPANTTWTDKTNPAIRSTDIASLLAVVPLNMAHSALGTHTLWHVGGIGAQFVATNLYCVLVTVSAATLTSTSTSDITVQLGISDD